MYFMWTQKEKKKDSCLLPIVVASRTFMTVVFLSGKELGEF